MRLVLLTDLLGSHHEISTGFLPVTPCNLLQVTIRLNCNPEKSLLQCLGIIVTGQTCPLWPTCRTNRPAMPFSSLLTIQHLRVL